MEKEEGMRMPHSLKGWLVVTLLLGTTAYCLAEEIVLTTYYPSPRGVYHELRTLGNVQVGTLEPPTDPTVTPRLHVVGDGTAPVLRVEKTAGDPTFIID